MKTGAEIKAIIQENSKRRAVLFSHYDPVSGEGSPIERKKIEYTLRNEPVSYAIPVNMYEDNKKFYDLIVDQGSIEEFIKVTGRTPAESMISQVLNGLDNIRFKYDFEFWAFKCAKIQDKKTKLPIPFILNRAQRRLLARIEKMRLEEVPIRLILLKARQWGGSTLVQIYMAWIQIIHRTSWHSVVVADVENQARNINGMYSRFAREYPVSMGKINLSPYERSSKSRIIEGRDCVISIGSAQKPDNLRSFDLAMCHFSEVGMYKATLLKTPEELVQGIRAAVTDVPYSLIVLESTAKGVGNFFHREWQAAVNQENGYDPLFVPWFEIEMYQRNIHNKTEFIEWVFNNSYAQFLWNLGATLEGIKWYFDYKRRESYSDWMMQQEFPSTDTEAFVSTGSRVFAPDYVKLARKNCMAPSFIGDISGASMKGKEALKEIIFQHNERGQLFIWQLPDTEEEISDRYCVTVDIGGRTKDADFSVIKVFDRYWMQSGGKPETVAVWRAHCFTPDTTIYTSEGFKYIKDVKIGDLAWTHNNRFRKVIRTYKNEYQGEIISIRSQGNYETINCTPEHPFFSNNVIQKIEKKPWKTNRSQYHRKEFIGESSWVKANDLKYIAYSSNKQDNGISQFIINKYNGGKSKNTERKITDLKSFYSILGYYLAEGHINKRSTDQKPASICFSFSYNERDTVAKDCYEKLLKLGFKCSIIEYKSVGVCRVRVCDTNLASLVLELCGEHSWNKRISPVILESPKELLSELLESYWKGDGSVYKTDRTISNTISTVSPILARQVRDILIMLGRRPGIYKVMAKTTGKNIKSIRPRYNIVWSASEIKKNSSLLDDKNVVYKVKTKTRQQYSGFVYNLEVEEDNSYSTACYVVHNCDQDLVAWKAAQIAKFYNNALLVIESNSLESESEESEGDHFLTVLDEIVKYYTRLYARTDPEKVRQGLPIRYGFHTDRSTKPMLIDELNGALREEAYIERDLRAPDEMDTYEVKPNGSYGATEGCKDDQVIVTALGVWICFKYMATPKVVDRHGKSYRNKIVSEATI